LNTLCSNLLPSPPLLSPPFPPLPFLPLPDPPLPSPLVSTSVYQAEAVRLLDTQLSKSAEAVRKEQVSGKRVT